MAKDVKLSGIRVLARGALLFGGLLASCVPQPTVEAEPVRLSLDEYQSFFRAGVLETKLSVGVLETRQIVSKSELKPCDAQRNKICFQRTTSTFGVFNNFLDNSEFALAKYEGISQTSIYKWDDTKKYWKSSESESVRA